MDIKKAMYMNPVKLGRSLVALRNKRDKYTPVGLKCSKRDKDSLTRLYNEYAKDLIHELLIDYGVKEGLINA